MSNLSQQPSWLKTAVFYQIYPQSFADSNGDGIGDIPGIISKLDYIASLGVNALWLNPIFESPFGDAGYDISDFRKVAPRYGTNKDAERLFKEAHKRGLKVVLDLVAGHTSDQHPWFKQACNDAKGKYANYFIFTGDEPQKPMFGDGPSRVPGKRPGYFMANFLPFQPALNYGYLNPDPAKPWQLPTDHPDCLAVRTELRDIMKFWLDAGCDGFRVDMASSLVKGDDNAVALRRLWQGFRAWLDREYPEAVLVSEWSHPINALESGFHIDFMIHFGEPAYTHLVGPGIGLTAPGKKGSRRPHVFFERSGEGDITLFLNNYLKHYTATKGKGYISLPTGNHDFQRPRDGREMDEVRVLFAMLFTMPGTPFLYYGDEIGMRNINGLPEKEGSMWRTGNRTPMQWKKGVPNLGFSTASPKKLYLPVDPAADAPTVSEQEGTQDSHLAFTRKLIALRRKYSALSNDGEFKPLYATPGFYPFVYERSDAKGRFAVAINPGETPVALEMEILQGAKLVMGEGAKVVNQTLSMDGVSFGIFRLKN
jgi:maltose alpha-D-glucosyltransferase/alpha-amylase